MKLTYLVKSGCDRADYSFVPGSSRLQGHYRCGTLSWRLLKVIRFSLVSDMKRIVATISIIDKLTVVGLVRTGELQQLLTRKRWAIGTLRLFNGGSTL